MFLEREKKRKENKRKEISTEFEAASVGLGVLIGRICSSGGGLREAGYPNAPQ